MRGHTRKKRKRDKDHDDSSDDDVMVDGKGTVSDIAHDRPGELLLSGMKMVQKALQGSGIAGERDETVLSGQVIPYLNSIIFPSLPSERLNIRLRRELITLGEALDLLMSGSLDKVGDLLMQRIKALELSVREGTWERAGHLE
eukprot:808394-Amphidinium_carterae.1